MKEKQKNNDLCERTFKFTVDVLTLLEKLPENRKTGVVITQLAKSSTSIGANYEESQAAHSKSDFYFKIGICLRESRESNYWLRIIKCKKWLEGDNLLIFLIKESAELKKIFGKIFFGRQDET